MQRKTRTQALSWLLTLAMLLSLVPGVSLAAEAADSVSYRAATVDGTTHAVTFADSECSDYTVINESTKAWNAGWYVVDGDVTISDRITVTGTVNLILMDGKTLTAERGIMVVDGNTLNIYGQTEGTGTLNANAKSWFGAGIGGGYGEIGETAESGTITINGGTIIAGGSSGAGIGGGDGGNGNGGTITINGGKVTAAGGSSGAGIGGGSSGTGGTITINGGEITATGEGSGAGIGGGSSGAGGEITINGGKVTATGGYGAGIGGGEITINGGAITSTGGYGAGIGSGVNGTGGKIIINGGMVTATGNSGAGIGGGGGDESGGGGEITINGGMVTAASSLAMGIGVGGYIDYDDNDNEIFCLVKNHGTVTLGNVTVKAGTNEDSAVVATNFAASHTQLWVNIQSNTPPDSVSLPATLVVGMGEKKTLYPSFSPSKAADIVTWSSDTPSVATVDAKGVVTGGAAGTATITVTSPNATGETKTATCTVTVLSIPVAGVSLEYEELTISTGAPETLTATVLPDNATNKTVTWESSDPSVATVDENGVVTGVRRGTATITVKTVDGEKTATCTVTVVANVNYLAWNTEKKELESRICYADEYTSLAASNTVWNAEWYVVDSDVTISDRVTVTGTVNLILMDGKTLTAEKGIAVTRGNILNIYGQTAGTGTLTATVGEGNDAGIGGGGTITINGGTVNATGGTFGGSGIGGGGTITINGGTVSATGGTIGGNGIGGFDETITINGGTVTAIGAGIESGIGGDTITINGGTVTAIGASEDRPGISARTVNLGNVMVKAGKDAGTAIPITNNAFKSDHKQAWVQIQSITPPDSVSLPETLALIKGNGETLTPTFLPEGTADSVMWSSSNTSVATVDANGKVTGVGVGTATITVTTVSGNKTATCAVTVSPVAVTGVSLDKAAAEIKIGGTETLTATVAPNNATYQTVTWSSSDTSVATVDENGVVTGVGAGTATITATATNGTDAATDDKTATCEITVLLISVESVTLDRSSATINKDATLTLTATVTPEDARNKTVTWSSSNNSVATVDENGVVTGVGVGTATITVAATDGNKTATCDVTVIIPVASVTLDQSEATVAMNEKLTLAATVLPDNATNKTVTWSSSNNSVATVANGVVSPKEEGAVTITARVGDKSATCAVTVVPARSSYTFTHPSSLVLRQSGSGLTVSVDGGEPIPMTDNVANLNCFTVAGTLLKVYDEYDESEYSEDLLWVTKTSANNGYLVSATGAKLQYDLTVLQEVGSDYFTSLTQTPTPALSQIGVEEIRINSHPVGEYTDTVTFTTRLVRMDNHGDTLKETERREFTVNVTLIIEPDPDVSYLAWDGTEIQTKTISGVRYGTVSSNDAGWRGNWYVVKDNVTINNAISVYDTVNLIICDGAALTLNGGITGVDSNLNVYPQSASSKLIASNINIRDGMVSFHGGTVEAGAGGIRAAKINIYESMVTTGGSNGSLTVYGGSVTADGKISGTLTMNDGTVIAKSGVSGNVTVNAGTLIADSSDGAGINGAVTLNSGTVTAAGSGNGAGVNGNVTVKDGTLTATGGETGKGIVGTITIPSGYAVFNDSVPNPIIILNSPYNAAERSRYMVVRAEDFTASISYLDANGEEKECAVYQVVSEVASAWVDGWYFVNRNLTISDPVSVSGAVNLILGDGVTLTAAKGITVNDGSVLNIYGQSRGSGKLTATGNSGAAVSGTVNLYSCTLTANGTADGVNGTLTIYGGRVIASGVSGAGVNGAVTLHVGEINATSTNGDGITGSSLIVEDGYVTAAGINGVSSTNVNVSIGTLKATGTTGSGISGTLVIGEDRMLQGGANSEGLVPMETTEKMPYMQVTESVYTIFYQDTRGWELSDCTYTWDGGSETVEMTRDGDFWRATAHHLPTAVTFSMGEDTTGAQTVSDSEISTVTGDSPLAPDGKTVAGYGKFFVIAGGCRAVTFVDYNRTWSVMVPDGGTVARPENPVRPDYEFNGWVTGYYYSYGRRQSIFFNFSRPIKSSITVYASYDPNTYYVRFQDGWNGGWAGTAVKYGETFRLGSVNARYASDVFQGWFLSGSGRVLNLKTNEIETLPSGTKFDFDLYGVAGNISLIPKWQHVHQYEKLTYLEYEAKYNKNSVAHYSHENLALNGINHVVICEDCKTMRFEAHNFVNGVCADCGFRESDVRQLYHVEFFASDENGTKDLGSTKGLEGRMVSFPRYIGDGVFMSYQVFDITDPDNPVLIGTEYNSNMCAFAINGPTRVIMVHRSRWQRFPQSSVKLTTSKASGNSANLQLNWSLSTGCTIVSAGILTTTNAELQKYSYSTFGGTKTLDTNNLLKSNQRSGSYDGNLRDQMKNRMVNGDSYDPNTAAVIHDFPVSNRASSGSYLVPHEIPSSTSKYGPWVYAVGYVTYLDTYGRLYKLYTNPVAISTTDTAHTVEYVRHDSI